MTTRRRLFQIAALIGGSVLLASAFSLGANSRGVQGSPSTNNSAATTVTATGDASRLITWLDRTTLPMLDDAHAIRNSGQPQFQLTRPRLIAGNSQSINMERCEESWRPLISGPLGREVTNICPNSELLPLPKEDLTLQSKLQLPPIAAFNSAFDGDHLEQISSPHASGANQAASSAIHSLTTHGGQHVAAPQLPTTHELPYLNPLGWSVSPSALLQLNSVG